MTNFKDKFLETTETEQLEFTVLAEIYINFSLTIDLYFPKCQGTDYLV